MRDYRSCSSFCLLQIVINLSWCIWAPTIHLQALLLVSILRKGDMALDQRWSRIIIFPLQLLLDLALLKLPLGLSDLVWHNELLFALVFSIQLISSGWCAPFRDYRCHIGFRGICKARSRFWHELFLLLWLMSLGVNAIKIVVLVSFRE